MQKYKNIGPLVWSSRGVAWGISGWLASAVGVCSVSEFLDSALWSKVLNAVAEWGEEGFTTTTTGRLLFTTFGLHISFSK